MICLICSFICSLLQWVISSTDKMFLLSTKDRQYTSEILPIGRKKTIQSINQSINSLRTHNVRAVRVRYYAKEQYLTIKNKHICTIRIRHHWNSYFCLLTSNPGKIGESLVTNVQTLRIQQLYGQRKTMYQQLCFRFQNDNVIDKITRCLIEWDHLDHI